MRRILHQIYLLELENYALGRYFRLWHSHLRGPAGERRKPLVWTKKLVTVTALAVLIWALDMLAFAEALNWTSIGYIATSTLLIAASFLSATFFAFVYLGVATWLLLPLDRMLKAKIIFGARAKLSARVQPLIIIGITGSYGKTSMKRGLATVLSERFVVRATPESVNTPVGIARFITQMVGEETNILIVEMGAYRRGDIAQLCALTPPNISVLTGINEAHLERFGSLANTIAAKFEIVENAVDDGLILLNADDTQIADHAKEYIGERTVSYYSQGTNEKGQYRAERVHFDQEAVGMHFILSSPTGRVGEFTLPFLAEYVVGIAQAAAIIGAHLGMEPSSIASGIQKMTPAPHRLKLSSRENNMIIIDDSYNANPDGAAAAIVALKQFEGRRRVYVTPGLVETGVAAKEVHRALGRALAGAAEEVVLIRNSVTPYIAEGLAEAGFDTKNIRWFDSSGEQFAQLPNTFKAGDVVLFQNDWPENYQ